MSLDAKSNSVMFIPSILIIEKTYGLIKIFIPYLLIFIILISVSAQDEYDVLDPANLNPDSRFFNLFLPWTIGNNLVWDPYYVTINTYVDPFREKVKISKNAVSSCAEDINCQIKAYQKLFLDEKQVYIEEIRIINKFNARAIEKSLSEPRITNALMDLNSSFDKYVSCMDSCTCFDSAYESCKSGSTSQNCDYDCRPEAAKPLHIAYQKYLAEEGELNVKDNLQTEFGTTDNFQTYFGEISSDESDGTGIGSSLFIALITIASGILMWYFIFKFILKKVKKLKK